METQSIEVLLKLLTVLGLAAVELWAAIPAGLALQLGPLVTGVTAAIGAMMGVLVVLVLGERIRNWLLRRHGGASKDKHHGRIYRIWSRYGVVGLGLLAPLLFGAPLGTAVAITLGAPTRQVLLWMSLGIALWSALLTIASALGMASIETLRHWNIGSLTHQS